MKRRVDRARFPQRTRNELREGRRYAVEDGLGVGGANCIICGQHFPGAPVTAQTVDGQSLRVIS